uniref:vesicle-fusing ATPase n=1 Tax=Odontella aurita TaxID=265563 RepID=A0A7S4JD61_9STRA|eukprot:CAMPEP_0113539646 /NCGR_PEP_ID=MMETSP0015_2-20120614/8041_1 /TAXON_ID=2838 /ORGANISM="Odontella" /LENGTH=448 /DNA_ID=CAMNT_0000439363 /DNA_START=107 /DNA_END=1453 /DNA_ORIENTATION=+ /assembly_acc=CAM_ASM_000160
MENKFIPDAIEIVSKAITADNEGEYEKALTLYRDALGRFTMGLKYEKNESRKKLIIERVEGYMKRAEELRDYLNKQSELGPKGEGGTGMKKKGDEEDDDSKEKQKLRGALSSAIVTEKPNVKWDDVAGLEGAKESLKETVILPTRFPQLFTGKRRPFKGILLYGPPGTGKSYLAKAVATESDATFFSVSSADLISKWQGESERLVRNLFEMARESDGGRAIIFIDEVDSLCGSRSEGESDSLRRVKTEFLVQMDGVGQAGKGDVLILGATNIPWELDAAIRRRFEKRVYIPLPEKEPRTFMVKLHLGDTPNSLTDADFDTLGAITEGASGSDIKILVKEALMQPLRRCQQAKQFFPDNDGFLMPCTKYPNCSRCPPRLSSDPPGKDYTCDSCGAIRMSLWDVPPEKLKAPDVCVEDFQNVLKHSFSSVSEDELGRYTEWTQQFGQEGG